jgi:DNA-binding NtrC family response regulator
MISRRQLLVGGTAAIGATAVRWPAWGASAPVEGRVVVATASPLDEILGGSRAIVAFRDSIRALLERVAGLQRRPPVLLLGENGVGKDLAAHVIHRAGPQSGGRFVSACVPAIPDVLLDVELYGDARGAITVPREKLGACQLANGGTLFLDEVALLHARSWPKIARVIETGRVRRLGAVRWEPADFWTIATSSSPLDAPIGERTLRDVLEPLEPVILTVPPLRERSDDVQLLADHFLARHCREYNRPAKVLTPDARRALGAFPWPGNVRHLANVMERALLLAEGRQIEAMDLGHDLATWMPRGG